MSDAYYGSKKNPNFTYVSSPVGKDGSVRYVSKVFDIEAFKEFYYEQKKKKVYEVIRDGERQEVTAIYNKEQNGFTLRIQRFTKETAVPHGQSFSFHGGALKKFLDFIESLKILDYDRPDKYRISEAYIQDILSKRQHDSARIRIPDSIEKEKLIALFNALKNEEKNLVIEKFIENIDLYELENLDAAVKQREYKKALEVLEKLVALNESSDLVKVVNSESEFSEYKANQPEKIYQNWIERNLWIFGVEYHRKHDFRRIGIDNSQADIVLETMDGFLSLIEIKRPIHKSRMFRHDESHRCYFPAREFSEAIGQCLIYLQRLADYKEEVSTEHDVSILTPRIKLIIGRSGDYSQQETEALHFINSSLRDIEVITYDQMVSNGKKIISYYDRNDGQKSERSIDDAAI